MKHIKLFEDFIDESLSASDKKKFEDFFKKALGKKCKLRTEHIEEEGILLEISTDMYQVKDGIIAIELDYLLSTNDMKLVKATPNKIVWTWGDTFELEIT